MQALGGDTWLQGGLSGQQRTGGLTEAQLTDELGPDFLQLPIPRNASATISWWQVRQAAFDRALQASLHLPSTAAHCAGSSVWRTPLLALRVIASLSDWACGQLAPWAQIQSTGVALS